MKCSNIFLQQAIRLSQCSFSIKNINLKLVFVIQVLLTHTMSKMIMLWLSILCLTIWQFLFFLHIRQDQKIGQPKNLGPLMAEENLNTQTLQSCKLLLVKFQWMYRYHLFFCCFLVLSHFFYHWLRKSYVYINKK